MHPLLADCLRLTVGTPEENAAMVAALEQSLAAARRVHPSQVPEARKAP